LHTIHSIVEIEIERINLSVAVCHQLLPSAFVMKNRREKSERKMGNSLTKKINRFTRKRIKFWPGDNKRRNTIECFHQSHHQSP
ncbi:hypothetical protein T09_6665, partial [Trichinella sp. T9]